MAPQKLLPTMDDLCHSLQAVKPNRRIAFLVGSPLSMQDDRNAPQVPGVGAMLELIRARITAKAIPSFDTAILDAKSTGGNVYQVAMKFLQVQGAQEAANEVIREAVLKARKHPESHVELQSDRLNQLDENHDGWALPPATRDLCALVVNHPHRFGPILTTNFDPLLSAGIKQAGGEFSRTVIDGDVPFSQTKSSVSNAARIIHLHGYWTGSETLHTPEQIARPRPRVQEDIRNILQTQTLVVVGYGGWDDIFMQTLSSLNIGSHVNLDVLWAFYEADEEKVYKDNSSIFKCVNERIGKNQFRPYGGVDCHKLFARLRDEARVSKEAAPSPQQAIPPAHAAPLPVPPPKAPPLPPPPSARAEPVAAQASPAASVITFSPVITVSPVIQQAPTPPPKEGRFTASQAVMLVVIPLLVGTVALVTQKDRRSGAGTATPSPVKTLPIVQNPVLAPAPAPSVSISVLRQQHRVTAASISERGSRVSQLPKGRYAYIPMDSIPTYSANTPIFESARDGIEIHRALSNDEVFLVGYAEPQAVATLESNTPAPIVLVAAPSGRRTQVASIPVPRMTTSELRQDKGTRVLVIHLN